MKSHLGDPVSSGGGCRLCGSADEDSNPTSSGLRSTPRVGITVGSPPLSGLRYVCEAPVVYQALPGKMSIPQIGVCPRVHGPGRGTDISYLSSCVATKAGNSSEPPGREEGFAELGAKGWTGVH